VLAPAITDPDAWIDHWAAAGGEAWAAGDFRRAADCYATALRVAAHASEPGRGRDLWRRQRDCWERVVDGAGERLAIPYENTTLPGYLFRAADEPRPLVIVNRGAREPASAAWALGGAAAERRGYHWMTFDGPGQGAALLEQALTSRLDWEHVLTPVVDALVARADVEPGHLAVIGSGEAGLLVPRALSFEQRIAAATVDPGVVDLAAQCALELSGRLRAQLRDGDAAGFDRELHLAELFSHDLRVHLDLAAAPFGLTRGSRFELFRAVTGYRLGDELERVRTPLLVVEREGDDRWPGQSRALYDRLPGPKRIVTLRDDDDDDDDRERHLFDWLDAHLG
jgi:hypothetical protein